MKISTKNRKIGYTYGSVSGHFAFRKEKSIAFESTLERDLLTILEFNNSVSDVIEQPMTIEYTNDNGRDVTYTPDFLVFFNEPDADLMRVQRKPLLIEVKPRDRLVKDWNKLKKKFQIGIRYAHANDMIFKVYDESRIRNTYLKNVLFLKRYKRLTYNEDDTMDILSLVHASGSLSVEHILEHISATQEQKGMALGQVWNMVANKQLLCLLDSPLNIKTIVWLNEDIEMGVTI
jgi:hypothetical protein